MKTIKDYKYEKDNKFDITKVETKDSDWISKEDAINKMIQNLKEINRLQQALYAERQEGVIFIFQAMDAAGKDGTIREVFSSLSPHGVKEHCFKAPTSKELAHDFLWRFWDALPEKGHISIFNRSYYEDVLVGKVHKLYKNMRVPKRVNTEHVIKDRYKAIKDYEEYLYKTGTRVVKIFLNVSKDEQARRFISRMETPRKFWKVSPSDLKEREYWDKYQEAFEDMVNKTSTDECPWYVVPADDKWYQRYIVSEIVLNTLREAAPEFPESEVSREKLDEYLAQLKSELND
jgi:PPK2 family polyphosphate:nucleotide phosphotransferase